MESHLNAIESMLNDGEITFDHLDTMYDKMMERCYVNKANKMLPELLQTKSLIGKQHIKIEFLHIATKSLPNDDTLTTYIVQIGRFVCEYVTLYCHCETDYEKIDINGVVFEEQGAIGDFADDKQFKKLFAKEEKDIRKVITNIFPEVCYDFVIKVLHNK